MSEFKYHFNCRVCGHKIVMDGLCTVEGCVVEGPHASSYPKATHPNIWRDQYQGTHVVQPFAGWPLDQSVVEETFHSYDVQ